MDDERGTVTVEGDTASVTFRRRIAADPARVWELLSSSAGLAVWLAPGSIEPAAGGAVTVDFGEGEGVTGRVMVWEPHRRLAYTWLIEGEPESVVEWLLEPEGSATALTLTHRSLPAVMARGYGAGWHAHLDRFAAAVTGAPAPGWDERFTELLEIY